MIYFNPKSMKTIDSELKTQYNYTIDLNELGNYNILEIDNFFSNFKEFLLNLASENPKNALIKINCINWNELDKTTYYDDNVNLIFSVLLSTLTNRVDEPIRGYMSLPKKLKKVYNSTEISALNSINYSFALDYFQVEINIDNKTCYLFNEYKDKNLTKYKNRRKRKKA